MISTRHSEGGQFSETSGCLYQCRFLLSWNWGTSGLGPYTLVLATNGGQDAWVMALDLRALLLGLSSWLVK